MAFYYGKGIFSNQDDTSEALSEALERTFDSHKITRHGAVAIFEARKN